MAYTPNLTIKGGGFTDFEGNPLASGYLIMQLSHDENYSIGPNQVVGGFKLRITLDNNGNIPTNPAVLVYSNDVLLPSGSFYSVDAFKADGTRAWANTQYWTLLASPNPLDAGTIVPTNPPGPSGSGSSTLLLQTNETNNGSQSLLDLHAGNNITLTDNGSGRVTVATTGGPTFSTAGQGGFFGPGMTSLGPYLSLSSSPISTTPNQISVWQFQLFATYTISKVSMRVVTGSAATTANFGIYDSSGNKLIDSTALSTASSSTNVTATLGTPVTLSPGTYYFAQSCTSGTPTTPGMPENSAFLHPNILNLNATRTGQAANSTSGGVMPATLGTITADTLDGNIAMVFFEV